MIVAKWNDNTLVVSGHSDNESVCAAVSVLTTALHVTTGAVLGSGEFRWDVSPEDMDLSLFVVNALRLMCCNDLYKPHIRLEETL